MSSVCARLDQYCHLRLIPTRRLTECSPLFAYSRRFRLSKLLNCHLFVKTNSKVFCCHRSSNKPKLPHLSLFVLRIPHRFLHLFMVAYWVVLCIPHRSLHLFIFAVLGRLVHSSPPLQLFKFSMDEFNHSRHLQYTSRFTGWYSACLHSSTSVTPLLFSA